jgi:hypothetical protein
MLSILKKVSLKEGTSKMAKIQDFKGFLLYKKLLAF